MRKKIAFWNLVSSLIFQFVNLLAGVLIPRYIIIYYGSEVNGLINSLTQFLSYISLTEARNWWCDISCFI